MPGASCVNRANATMFSPVSNDWTGILISVFALLFAVGSFWWLQMRRGRLKGFAPHSFAAFIDGSLILFLRLPILMYNSGAAPIVVLDMYLRFPDEPRSAIPLPWRRTHPQLAPVRGEVGLHPAVFAVPGRSTGQFFVEFGGPWPGFEMQFDSSYRCVVETKLGHNGKWKQLVDFSLVLPRMANPDENATYRNSPWQPTADDKEKVAALTKDLLARINEPRGDPPTS